MEENVINIQKSQLREKTKNNYFCYWKEKKGRKGNYITLSGYADELQSSEIRHPHQMGKTNIISFIYIRYL